MGDNTIANHNEIGDYEKVLVFTIGDNRRIIASMMQEIDEHNELLLFRQMAVRLDDGKEQRLLATVDYEPRSAKEKGISTLCTRVYSYEKEDPVHMIYPLKRHLAWVSFEKGTYRINVCDVENYNAHETALEADGFNSFFDANLTMEKTIEENPQYLWTRLPFGLPQNNVPFDPEIKVGGEYRQQSKVVHVIAMSNGMGLLEVREHNEVSQYIVSTNMCLDDDGELCCTGEAFAPDYSQHNAASFALAEAWKAFHDKAERLDHE